MTWSKHPAHQRAAPGDLLVGKLLDDPDTWLSAKVVAVDSDGYVATIAIDDAGDMAVHRAFVGRSGDAVGWMVVPAAQLTSAGREELVGLAGDIDSLKAEFRKFKAETIQ